MSEEGDFTVIDRRSSAKAAAEKAEKAAEPEADESPAEEETTDDDESPAEEESTADDESPAEEESTDDDESTAEEETTADASELSTEEELPEEEPAERPEGLPSSEELAQLFKVNYVLISAIDQLQRIAWVGLGLQPHPFTNKVEADLPEAQAAIDLLGDLVNRFEQQQGAAEARELKLLLSNLRINYVQKSGD